jgi:hypothetical protein
MRGTSVPVWVRRSTFVVRVGGGTKADRRWLCRGTTKDAPGLSEVQANRQKTRKPRATRIDVGVEVIDDALRDPTDHAVMWSLWLCGGRHLLALDFGTSPTGRPHKLGKKLEAAGITTALAATALLNSLSRTDRRSDNMENADHALRTISPDRRPIGCSAQID